MREIEHGVSAPPTISVIVPVYNTEKYLRRCIDSVLAQTYQDFELLLIDDGSKDSSGAICDEYAAQDARVKVFHKENGGVSSARNVGLDNARGEWITFVDSDDYIEENFLKSFEGNLDADLVVGGMIEKGPQGNLLRNIPSGYHHPLKNAIVGNLTKLPFQSACEKLFRGSLVKKLRFDESMIIGEDHYFILRYVCIAKSIRILDIGNDCECFSHYIYISPTNMCKKYQISVQSSVYHMLRLEEAYQMLGVKDIQFEEFIAEAYYDRCMNDLPEHGYLWYKNKEVERLCLRRSAHLGIIPWVRTWLSFHMFYRLKMYLSKRHAYR